MPCRVVTVSYSKQSSGRSICSDGVLRWLESQGEDTYIKADGEGKLPPKPRKIDKSQGGFF